MTWKRLLQWSAGALIVTAALVMAVFIHAFDPVLGTFLILFAVSLVLLPRFERASSILVLIVVVLFIGAGAPFFIAAFLEPRSTYEFVSNALLFVEGIVAGISAVALLRRRDAASRAAALTGRTAIGVIVLAVILAVVARVTAPTVTIEAGDLRLTAQDTEFSTEQLDGDGPDVTVAVVNKDLGSHTFTIDELDVNESLPGQATTRVSFDAPPGTYTYYCAVQGHRPTMHGTLTVR
ncbi:MAG TPA: cupredoxin domain-containing protein [Actinomycetota bacterium]|nr:cupredoxin domain-containing protein [Actinomycetota bacterium]